MSSLSRFMKSNKKVRKNGFYAPTRSLVDENGKPLEWEFKPLSSKENERIRDDYTVDVQVTGKPNMYRPRLNTSGYLVNMVAACVVTPNLYDKELQDSYGVKKPDDLIYAMVDDPGEYQDLCAWVQKYQGFTQTLDEKVEEAKN
ncbi:MAG: hypothetical protein NC489_28720 [Ruminococcus flavefaciens]|nr:hypothetical protein [Ruminococcus flavefaciens]